MNVTVCRHVALGVLSAVLVVSDAAKAAAQVPAPPGVVVNREGVDANGKAVRRFPVVAMTAATKARIRELIAVQHPEALQGSPAIRELTFVLGPRERYVNSTVGGRSSAPAAARAFGGVAFIPSRPRSVEYGTFAPGEAGPNELRVVVVNVM